MSENFDQMPRVFLAADHYMVLADIVTLIKGVFIEPPSSTQGWKGQYDWVGVDEAVMFFTPPCYPAIAVAQLGYLRYNENFGLTKCLTI